MSLQPNIVRFFDIPKTQRFHTQYNRRWRSLGLAALICLLLPLLAACGPQRRAGESDLTAQTVRIAQAYEQDGDLNRARVQLQALDAANPTQWLIYLAEARVHEQPGQAETNALVWLAMALGLQSRPLVDYAGQNNLLVNAPPPTLETAAQAGSAAISLAPATETPAAPPTPAVDPAGSAAVTTSTVTTSAVTTTVGAGASMTVSQGVSETAPAVPEPAALPTATTVTKPMAQASNTMNVRGGPGTAYPVVGAINAGDQVEIVGKNPQADWWQVLLANGTQGWVYGPLVQTAGDTTAIAVAANIPEPPPTPTPAPVAAAPTTAPAPAEQPPAEQPPAETPQPEQPPAPAPDGPDFVAVEKRLWDVYENGGSTNGGSVTCGEKRELHVNVLDAAGNRINGVAVQAIYGAQEVYVTGAQGKGDGQVEFVLGRGQGVKVIRDADGREVTSETVDGLSTEPANIPYETLIGARYCDDEADCKAFVDLPGCWGHYSWTVTFKRKY